MRWLLLLVTMALGSGCFTTGYLLQAASGQYELLHVARPLSVVREDPAVPPRIRALLSKVPAIKRYGQLNGLTPTGNYERYAELHRPAAVRVVQGCKSLAFEPKRWAFPLVGTVPYPGFFNPEAARAFAAELAKQEGDLDVTVRTASAYSTLGWFKDPVLSTMMPVNAYMSAGRRAELAADLNNLIASPAFATWRRGQDLDVGRWMLPVDGKTPATIISVAHLDDEERALVLGVILEEALTWVRSLPGTARLRALIVFDEVYGFIPPHPKSPPTKRPMVALMKQARAYGVGCVLATQNPMDLDYRALSNAGTWLLGRLQTDADRERVIEGLGEDKKKSAVSKLLKKIRPLWFVAREASGELTILQPRWAMSHLRGPMTSKEIRRVR